MPLSPSITYRHHTGIHRNHHRSSDPLPWSSSSPLRQREDPMILPITPNRCPPTVRKQVSSHVSLSPPEPTTCSPYNEKCSALRRSSRCEELILTGLATLLCRLLLDERGLRTMPTIQRHARCPQLGGAILVYLKKVLEPNAPLWQVQSVKSQLGCRRPHLPRCRQHHQPPVHLGPSEPGRPSRRMSAPPL
jgi:hypothetical protein